MVGRKNHFIIDAKFLVESAEETFRGTPLLPSANGKDHTVVFGFTRDLLRLRRRLGIASAILVFHSGAEAVASGKNFSEILSLMKKLKMPVVHHNGPNFRDIFKQLAPKARWIVSKDLALAQLVSDNLHLLVPTDSGEITIFTVEYLRSHFGVDPYQVPSFLALAEEKDPLLTKRQAKKFLEDHRSLECFFSASTAGEKTSLYRKVQDCKGQLLKRHSELKINGSRKMLGSLSALFSIFPKDAASVERVLEQHGFYSLARLLPIPEEPEIDINPQVDPPRSSYQVINSKETFSELIKRLSNVDICAVDTETSGKDPRTASPIGVSISIESGAAFYVPLVDQSLNGISREKIIAGLRTFFAKKIRVIGHNLKYDSLVLRRLGITISTPYFDTMLAAHDCYGDLEFFNLSFLAKKLLGKKIKRYREIVGEGETFLDVPFSELVEHACCDVDTTLQLYHKLSEALKKRNLLDAFLSDRMNLMTRLEMIEYSGLAIDGAALRNHEASIARAAADLKKKIYSEVGFEFDLESIKAIGEALKAQEWFRDSFGIRQISSSLIEQMASRHPLIGSIASYRRIHRRKKDVDGIISSVTKAKVFPLFNQIKLPCGKLSSSDPNLEEALLAGAIDNPDLKAVWFSSDDAAQRLAQIVKDPILQDDLGTREPHKNIQGVPFLSRSNYSDVLLSVAINPSVEALSKRFCVSTQTAAKMRREMSTRYQVTFRWLEEFKRSALADGFAQYEGRRKYLDGLRSSDVEKKNMAVMSTLKWLLCY